jgi:hypothetical protein
MQAGWRIRRRAFSARGSVSTRSLQTIATLGWPPRLVEYGTLLASRFRIRVATRQATLLRPLFELA